MRVMVQQSSPVQVSKVVFDFSSTKFRAANFVCNTLNEKDSYDIQFTDQSIYYALIYSFKRRLRRNWMNHFISCFIKVLTPPPNLATSTTHGQLVVSEQLFERNRENKLTLQFCTNLTGLNKYIQPSRAQHEHSALRYHIELLCSVQGRTVFPFSRTVATHCFSYCFLSNLLFKRS